MKHCIKKQGELSVSNYVGLKLLKLFVLSLNCGLDVYIMKSMADLKKKQKHFKGIIVHSPCV